MSLGKGGDGETWPGSQSLRDPAKSDGVCKTREPDPGSPITGPAWVLAPPSSTLLPLQHSPELSIFHLQLQLLLVTGVNVVPLRGAGRAGERQ